MNRKSKKQSEQARDAALRYFAALRAHDLDSAVACWLPGGIDRIVGQEELVAPDGIRGFFSELFAAFPDFVMDVVDTVEDPDRCTVRWRAEATFSGPGAYQGIQPNGARVAFEGCDVVEVKDGLIVANSAYIDGASVARQLGVMPPQGSKQEERLLGLFNKRTKFGRKFSAGERKQVADGVWLICGGLPVRTMNVFLIEGPDGVTVFDAGVKSMTQGVAQSAGELGGISRIVLGHSHPDHRGAASGLGAPTYCHEAEVADAIADGGRHYFHYERLNVAGRRVMPKLIEHWDGGPVEIAGTVREGDQIGEFQVIHLPGHAPGMIALWRERDRLALTSDCFYTLDPQSGIKGKPRVPHHAFNQDTDTARASILKLAELSPETAWPGHADSLTGDVGEQLRRAAAV